MGVAKCSHTTEELLQKISEPETANAELRENSAVVSGAEDSVANISEREMEILLSISQQIASVRNRGDLLAFIIDRVQPLFGFNQYANITVYSSDSDTLELFFTKMSEPEKIAGEIPKFLKPFPVAGNFREIIKSDGIVVYDESFLNRPQTTPIDEAAAQIWRDLGFKYSLSVALKSFGKLVGTFHVHFDERKNFTDRELRFFKAVSELIAGAVANILANEEISEREREKALLLSLSEDMATIRDRNDLWRVMMEKVKPLVDFDDAVVAVYSKDRQTVNHILTTSPPERQTNSHYEQIVNRLQPFPDSPNEYLADRTGNFIVSTEELLALFPDHPGILLMRETGLEYTLHQKLVWGDEIIGQFHFHFARQEQIREDKFNLYKAIADQVTVAVANILANEGIIEREHEKTLLLSLSEDMATIRDRNDLWRVIITKMQPLIGFDDAVVVDFKDNAAFYRHFLTASPSSRQANSLYRKIVGDYFPVAGTPFEYVLTLGNSYEWHTAELLKLYPDHPGLLLCRETNLNYCVGFQLNWGGELLGLLQFAFASDFSSAQANICLYKDIANQVTVAVANILANEKILEREREKALLLSLSEEIAKIRDAESLFQIIYQKIQPVFEFDDAVLNLFDEQLEYCSYRHTRTPQRIIENHPFYNEMMTGKHLIKNTPVEEVLAFTEPQIVPLSDWVERYPDYVGIKIVRDWNYVESVYMPLRYGGKLLGVLEFHSRSPERFSKRQMPLFRNLGDQMAVAVANILANEEIIERTREKSTLLSISEDIASIKDREHLFEIIADKIKPIFNFDDAAIFIASETADDYHLFLHKSKENRRSSPHFEKMISGNLPLKNSIEEWIVNHDEAFICGTDEFVRLFPDAPGTLLMQKVGIKDSMLANLRSGGKIIGSFHVHSEKENVFQPAQLPLFQAVADQIAVAIANILANEEILEREHEKSQLLSISEAIARINDRNDLLQVIIERIQPVFGFDDNALFVIDADGQHYRMWYANLSVEYGEGQQSRNGAGIPIADNPIAGDVFGRPAQLLSREKMLNNSVSNTSVRHWLIEAGIQEALTAPLRVRGKIIGCFNSHSRMRGAFSNDKLPLYQTVADQIAVAVANILANEEIAALAEERRIRAEELERTNVALQNSTLQLSSLGDIELFVQNVLIEIIRETRAKSAAIFQLTADGEYLQMTHFVAGERMLDIANDARLVVWRETKKSVSHPMTTLLMGGETLWHDYSEKPVENDWEESFAFHQAMGHKTVAAVPFVIDGVTTGFLGIGFADSLKPTDGKMQLCKTLAQHVALALHLTHLSDEVRQSAVTEERNRFAREVHDTLAQTFTALVIQVQAARRIISESPPDALQNLTKAEEIARHGLTEARRAVRALRPLDLEKSDLPFVLQKIVLDMTEASEVQGAFSQIGTARPLAPELSATFLRVCQEAVTNAMRHANAAHISVNLIFEDDGAVSLKVEDDGVGFDLLITNPGFGIIGIRERAARIGANLRIESEPEKGTTIEISLE